MVPIDSNKIPRYLTGLTAVVLSIYFLYHGRSEISIVVASSFFLLICITDTLFSKIFNAATLALLIAGFAINGTTAGASGLLFSLWGCLLGFALLILPYLFGGMGGGDVKALAALGALVGPAQVFQIFLYTALIGGLLGLLHFALTPDLGARCREWRHHMQTVFLTKEINSMRGGGKSRSIRFPYAAAIAFGFFSYLNWGRII